MVKIEKKYDLSMEEMKRTPGLKDYKCSGCNKNHVFQSPAWFEHHPRNKDNELRFRYPEKINKSLTNRINEFVEKSNDVKPCPKCGTNSGYSGFTGRERHCPKCSHKFYSNVGQLKYKPRGVIGSELYRDDSKVEKETKYYSGKTGKQLKSHIRHGGKILPREEAIHRKEVGRLKEAKTYKGPKLPKGKTFDDLSREEKIKRLFG